MLSQKAKYALHALIMLAEQPEEALVPVTAIARRENVPHKFLEAILLDLRKHGLLESKRGKAGGYRLARPAHAITFGEVIRLLDGHLAPLPCASLTAYRPCDDCAVPDLCSVRWLMRDVRDAIANVLDRRTLADALRHRQASGLLPPTYEI